VPIVSGYPTIDAVITSRTRVVLADDVLLLCNSRAIADAVSGYVKWCTRLNRRFPFYWWEGRNGQSARYAMQPRVAALFRRARDDL
jgi:hypothetical protein